MATYTPNYNLSKPEPTDEYQDFLDSYGDNMDIIDLNLGGGGGGGGHTIVDPDGTDMPQENKLQFTGAVNVSDDAVNGQTIVDVEGGGNYYLNTIYSTEEKKVGYWTNNKPLYQITFETNYTSNGTYSIDISSLNVDTICNSFGEYNRSNGEWTEFNHYSGSTYYGEIRASATQVRMFLHLPENNPQGKQFFSIQYTKTTDTADPNPQTGGVIYLPTIYSEEEREVGVWHGGKPLYQKTYVINALPSSAGYQDHSLGLSDIDIKHSFGDLKWATGTTRPFGVIGLDRNSPTSWYTANQITYSIENNSFIRIIVGTDRRAVSGTITIQYTKTTDTAGSGTWTPSGANAVHYDGNEKVIGTWFGETLYEKTFHLSNKSISVGKNIIVSASDLSSLSIDKVIGTVNGCITLSGGTYVINIPYGMGATSYATADYDSAEGIRVWRGGSAFTANDIYLTIQYTKQ